MIDIPAHSHLEVLGLTTPSDDVECEMWLVNGGDAGDDEYLSVYGGASIPVSQENSRWATTRLRRAFPDVLVPGASRTPQISVEDFAGRGLKAHVFLNLEFKGKGNTLVRNAIAPFVAGFRRLASPSATAFICHASEDKPIVRSLVAYIEREGVGVWLDEREINVGESIVQRISDGLEAASHLVVVLSAHSVRKPWVSKELSTALMRSLAERSICILPVRLDESPVPVLLSDVKYADCRDGLEAGFRQLVDAMLTERGS